MPDITMCKGEKCQKKYSCFRFSANANMYQSYFIETPIKNNKCDFYMNVEGLNKWKDNILK